MPQGQGAEAGGLRCQSRWTGGILAASAGHGWELLANRWCRASCAPLLLAGRQAQPGQAGGRRCVGRTQSWLAVARPLASRLVLLLLPLATHCAFLERRWAAARDAACGLLPARWGSTGQGRLRRCTMPGPRLPGRQPRARAPAAVASCAGEHSGLSRGSAAVASSRCRPHQLPLLHTARAGRDLRAPPLAAGDVA